MRCKIAIMPTVTLLGIGFGDLLSGAVFAEIIFARPGVGKLIYDMVEHPQLSGRPGRGAGHDVLLCAQHLARRSARRLARPPCPRKPLRSPPRRRRGRERAGRACAGCSHDPLGLARPGPRRAVRVGALLRPLLAPYDPNAIDVPDRLAGPSLGALAGTDQLGRDIFSRVLYGGRIALRSALVDRRLAVARRCLLGMLAGYGPRWLDNALLLVFDTVRSFPTVMLALAAVTLAGPSLEMVILVVVVAPRSRSTPASSRTQTLSLKSAEFILAERSLGAGPVRASSASTSCRTSSARC